MVSENFSRRQADDQVGIVGLYLGFVCRFIARNLTATVAAMHENIAALGIGDGADGAENTATGVLSISGVNINVERAKAEGAMIARGVAERKHLSSAILAGEAVIVFCESFSFHLYSNPSPEGDCIQLRL